MAPLQDFQIQWVNGRRLLRFTAMMVNVGSGHFEVRGSRASTADPMTMRQVIYETSSRNSPISRQVPHQAVAKYAGDGHTHWHIQEMMRYDLWGGKGTFRGAKVGFCFLDSDVFNSGLPGYSGGFYTGSMCSSDPNVLSNQMGISIGMGDEYEWYLAWQWVDITGLPSGTYTLRAKVDPYGFFTEEAEDNQCGYAIISFTTASNAVTLENRAPGCINDWSGSTFAEHIAWMLETGISTGCAPELFCTHNPVTRGEMAAFLSAPSTCRPPPTTSSTTTMARPSRPASTGWPRPGSRPAAWRRKYCPGRTVTRGEMAAFLERAFDLPPTSNDYFPDDDSSPFEDSINRITAAGIPSGCTSTRYCPGKSVTRGQMAAFIHRALD